MVVLGRPHLVDSPEQATNQHRAAYRVKIEKVFKGTKSESRIEFLDLHFASTASLHLLDGLRYLVLLQTQADREPHHDSQVDAGISLTGLRAFEINDTNIEKVEEGIAQIKA